MIYDVRAGYRKIEFSNEGVNQISYFGVKLWKKHMKGQHHYALTLQWTGNKGVGTTKYNSYERSHIILIDNKPTISASSGSRLSWR